MRSFAETKKTAGSRKSKPGAYIPRSGEYITLKRQINSAEAAPIKNRSNGTTSFGGRLGLFQRALKNGKTLAPENIGEIEQIRDESEVGTTLHGWAERLLDEVYDQ